MADASADAVVIGGGAIGCAVARALAQRGLRVGLLERGAAGRGAVWAAGGMLSPLGETAAADPLRELALASLALYPAFIEALLEESGIDAEYRTDGKLHIALDAESERPLARLAELADARFGAEMLTGDAARSLVPGLATDVGCALFVALDHRVDNRRLADALVVAACRAGVTLRTDAEVVAVESAGGSVTGVRTAGGERIPAPVVVLAAGAWSGGIGGLPAPLPVRAVRGQMFAIDGRAAAGAALRHVLVSPGCYIVPRESGRMVVGATVEETGFAPGPTPAGIGGLMAAAARVLPSTASLPLLETWAGFRPGTPDDLPVLGADPRLDGLVYATGHYRNGILLTPVTAAVVADVVTGYTPAVDLARFSPLRFAQTEPPGVADRTARAALLDGTVSGRCCDLCGAPMIDWHCRLICRACGYQRDCTDP